jgi:prophage regulatory protein
VRLLKRKEVEEKVGLKRSEIYRRMDLGDFPLAIRIGPRQVAWAEHELDEWIEKRIAERFEHSPIPAVRPRGSKRGAAR